MKTGQPKTMIYYGELAQHLFWVYFINENCEKKGNLPSDLLKSSQNTRFFLQGVQDHANDIKTQQGSESLR